MSDFRFPKRMKLLKASDFERVFASRNFGGNSSFALYGAANDVGYARLGMTVSRRVGRAVERNRWKRVLREAFRLSQHELPAADYVCVVRGPVPPKLPQLMASIQMMATRIDRK